MCGCLGKKASKYLAILLIVGFIVMTCGAFWMAATSSRTFNSKYNPNPLNTYSNYILACVIIVLLFSFYGVFSLYCDSKLLLGIFQIIWVVLFVLTFIISIMALIVGNVGDLSSKFCSKESGAINSRKLDDYISRIDQSFCTNDCICNVKNITIFAGVNASLVTSNTSGALSFQDCTATVKTNTFQKANVTASDISRVVNDTNWDDNLFFRTWKWVEETYNCVGFCDFTYKNDKGNTTQYYKYLFSDTNRGIPLATKACFYTIYDDTVKITSSIGLYIIFVALYMLLIFFISMAWCCAPEAVDFSSENQAAVMINPNPNPNDLQVGLKSY